MYIKLQQRYNLTLSTGMQVKSKVHKLHNRYIIILPTGMGVYRRYEDSPKRHILKTHTSKVM